MIKPALLLLPNVLGEVKHHEPYLPTSVDKAVASIDGLIAESEGGARRFLGRFQTKQPRHLVPVAIYNKHTKKEDLDFLLEPIRKGERWGLISDAGLPCIADPGSALVARARQTGIAIQAYIGPCSFTLALMLSGLSGQKFSFHGYLDRNIDSRVKQLGRLEKMEGVQIIMETPYRNEGLLELLIKNLHEETILSVVWDLTLPTQGVITQPISIWRRSIPPSLNGKNAVFLFGSS